MYCPKCGKENSDSAKFCGKCGFALKGIASEQTMPESVSPPPLATESPAEKLSAPQVSSSIPKSKRTPTPLYAGFWRRAAASVYDVFLMNLLGGLMGFIIGFVSALVAPHDQNVRTLTQIISGILGFIIGWLYFSLQESSRVGATLGKRMIGIYVTSVEGSGIRFGKATGRFFAKILSALTLGIGFMMSGWTRRKQCLHDLAAKTLVLRRDNVSGFQTFLVVLGNIIWIGGSIAAIVIAAYLVIQKNTFDKTRTGIGLEQPGTQKNFSEKGQTTGIISNQAKIDEMISDGLAFNLGANKDEIIRNLGEPEWSNSLNTENRHDPGVMDSISELSYSGLFIRVYSATEVKRDMIMYIMITSDKYKLKSNLNVGTSKNLVKKVLGEPSEQVLGQPSGKNGDAWRYDDSESISHIQFHFSNDLIDKIEWFYDLD